jgi:hypothetical protein
MLVNSAAVRLHGCVTAAANPLASARNNVNRQFFGAAKQRRSLAQGPEFAWMGILKVMVSMPDFGVSFLNTTAVKMCEKVTSVREVVGKKLGIGD